MKAITLYCSLIDFIKSAKLDAYDEALERLTTMEQDLNELMLAEIVKD